MQLGRLCFVLPDFDEEDNDDFPKPASKRPRSNRRHCGGELFSTIRRSLHKFLDTITTADSCFRRHHANGPFFQDTAGAGFSDKVATGIGNPKIFSYAELYIGSKGFSKDELLGSGGFGRVYRAVLPSDGTVAAVKCLAEKGERFEKTFEAELAAVAHLRHRNLVRLRGWCVHEDQLLLVYDFMPNRSLDRILFRRPEKGGSPPALNWKRRDNIVKGLAAALFYLHEQLETQIIHRDVKASNVMLDSHYNARLGDFGLARWLEHELVYQNPSSSLKQQRFHLSDTTRIGGTIGYLPPESFQKKSTATAKSDVFSFGIVLMEVVSGRRALDLSFSDDKIVLLDWIRRLSDDGSLLQAVDNRIEDGSYRLSDMERFLHVGLLCTLQNPYSRPNMKWVIEAISGKMSGKLPVVPSFKTHPLYISLSSSSDSSSGATTTATTKTSSKSIPSTISSHFQTANNTERTTVYMTAENGGGGGSTTTTEPSFRKQPSPFMVVETPNEIPFSKLVTATNNFSDSNHVAEIDFGTAYHGYLSENKQHVLVKRLGMKTCPALRERFSNELQNLTRLRHRNLVQLRGWCTEHGEMLIVYDYSAKRLLSNILFRRHSGHSPLKWHHRYNIVKSLASAIRYLHEEWDEQVIHKSITTSAIVLDPDMNPRLSSFALAEFLTRKELGNGNHHVALDTRRSVRGIFGYISPEYMKSGEATPMADIYSFGVVLLELVTGQSAVDFRRPDVLLVGRMLLLDMQKEFSQDLVDMRLNGVYDRVELSRLVKLGIACTRSDAKSRPTVGQMVRILDGNDDCLMEIVGLKKESMAEWRVENDAALQLVRRIQSLGIQ